VTDVAADYAERGVVLARNLVPPELAGFLARTMLMRQRSGLLEADGQVPGSGSVYGDPTFDTLLELVGPVLSGLVGLDMAPTYSFARLYVAGCELTPHLDRGACEHSVTVHLGADEDEPWPIGVVDLAGVEAAIELAPGDAVCYQGRAVRHWRTPYAGRWHAQVFLHFVDREGPVANLAHDGRAALGTPPPQ
jgi:hypothetical protein